MRRDRKKVVRDVIADSRKVRFSFSKAAPMKRLMHLAALAAAPLLAACNSPIHFTGETHTDEALRMDIARKILIPLQMITRCPSVRKIETQVVEMNLPTVDLSGKGHPSDSASENWTIHMCGQRYAYQILLVPSIKDRPEFSVQQIAAK